VSLNRKKGEPQRRSGHGMIFEVVTVLEMSMFFFWAVTLCGLLGRYQRFGGAHCLHLQETSALNMEAVCSPETLISTYKPTQRYYPKEKHPTSQSLPKIET
jgi:hypothetical protein